MSVFNTFRDGIGEGVEEVTGSISDIYEYDFGIGPISVSIEDVFSKAYKRLKPPNSILEDNENIGAETVTVLGKSNPALDQENFVKMFQRQNKSVYDGAIVTPSKDKKRKIFAPFSTYTPTTVWPYQADDGSRYTVHNLARKDIGIPDWVNKPVSVLLRRDLDIDEDGEADIGGLPLFNLVGDPLMGIGPILLVGILAYTAANVVPLAMPAFLAP